MFLYEKMEKNDHEDKMNSDGDTMWHRLNGRKWRDENLKRNKGPFVSNLRYGMQSCPSKFTKRNILKFKHLV